MMPYFSQWHTLRTAVILAACPSSRRRAQLCTAAVPIGMPDLPPPSRRHAPGTAEVFYVNSNFEESKMGNAIGMDAIGMDAIGMDANR